MNRRRDGKTQCSGGWVTAQESDSKDEVLASTQLNSKLNKIESGVQIILCVSARKKSNRQNIS